MIMKTKKRNVLCVASSPSVRSRRKTLTLTLSRSRSHRSRDSHLHDHALTLTRRRRSRRSHAAHTQKTLVTLKSHRRRSRCSRTLTLALTLSCSALMLSLTRSSHSPRSSRDSRSKRMETPTKQNDFVLPWRGRRTSRATRERKQRSTSVAANRSFFIHDKPRQRPRLAKPVVSRSSKQTRRATTHITTSFIIVF